jgi:peroxiredoxin (alkyl hydroperoxide reductase subunit C)
MIEETKVGCARPTGGVVGENDGSKEPAKAAGENASAAKEVKSMIRVGQKAPDFIAPAYYKGKFVSVKLSEFLGKWVVLCLYPGDFTFV